jgi:glycosyltransferase involved in cell wall biosynthesis
MVRLVREVATQLPQTRWLMVGQGLQGEEKVLEAQLVEAGLAEYVRFTGWLPLDQLPAFFAATNVAIYPYDDTLINRTKCWVKLVNLLEAGCRWWLIPSAKMSNTSKWCFRYFDPAEDDALWPQPWSPCCKILTGKKTGARLRQH